MELIHRCKKHYFSVICQYILIINGIIKEYILNIYILICHGIAKMSICGNVEVKCVWYKLQKYKSVRSGIWTHAHISGPECSF